MSEVLIIYAHPETKGFCSTILEKVTKILKEKDIDYHLIDLYKIKYDPILKANEHYTTPGNRDVSKQNKEFQNLIKEHDKLIFIYPIWWNGVPAILKGFFDRVLTGGFAFSFKGSMPVQLLNGKKATVFLTHGGPNIFTTFLLRDRGAKIVTKDTLGFCGIKTKFFKIGNARKLEDKRIPEIEKIVKKGLGYLT